MILRFDMLPRSLAAVWRTFWFRLCGYQIIVSTDVQEIRGMTCSGCSLRDGEQCSKCGCFIEAKTWLAAEKCPDGQWPVVRVKKRLTGMR